MADMASDFVVAAGSPRRRTSWHLRAHWRLWRRRQAREAILRAVLAETSDPRIIDEAGLAPPVPNGLDLFARALLRHRH